MISKMGQIKVFYANCVKTKETDEFERKLKARGIEFDSIEGIEELRKEPYSLEKRMKINRIFNDIYVPNLKDYNLLIEHLGVTFGEQYLNLLKKYSNLQIARVSEFVNIMSSKEDRTIICGYNSPELFQFINKALNLNINEKKLAIR